jgi:hypothetical protein
MKDPIVEEIHRFREDYAKRFNYDIDAMFADIQAKQAKNPHLVDRTELARAKRERVAEERAKYGEHDG